jgi:hypothetical protein
MKCKNFERRSAPGTDRRVQLMENADQLYRDVAVAVASSSNATSKTAMNTWAQHALTEYLTDLGAVWGRLQKEGMV